MEHQIIDLEQTNNAITKEINKMIELYYRQALTQRMVAEWLETIPEDEREYAKDQLESALSDIVSNLPA